MHWFNHVSKGTWYDAPTFASGPTPGIIERDSIVCGDGIVDVEFGEQCDDGNVDPGDGCSATCTVEEGWNCADAQPSLCFHDDVPAASTWGLIILAMLILSAGTLVMSRRKPVAV